MYSPIMNVSLSSILMSSKISFDLFRSRFRKFEVPDDDLADIFLSAANADSML